MVARRSSVGRRPIEPVGVQELHVRLGHLLALAHSLVGVPGHVDPDVVQLQPHLNLAYRNNRLKIVNGHLPKTQA